MTIYRIIFVRISHTSLGMNQRQGVNVISPSLCPQLAKTDHLELLIIHNYYEKL